MQLDYILTDKLPKRAFEQTVYNWLAEGDYTPDDVLENIVAKHNMVLMPLHCYVTDYYGSCSASLGYIRWEDYYEWDDFNKKQIRKRRSITDWHPYSQAAQGTVSTVVYSGTPVPDKVIQFIESMDITADDLQTVSETDPHYRDVVNLFSAAKIDAWNQRGVKKAYSTATQNTVAQFPSQLIQNLSFNINFSERQSFSVLAPYWFCKYQYGGKEYYVLADCNHPGRIDGVRPIDHKRKKNVVNIRWFGWLVGIAAIVMTILLLGESFSEIDPILKGAIIAVLGLIFTGCLVENEVGKIKKKSLKYRKEKLGNKLKQLN